MSKRDLLILQCCWRLSPFKLVDEIPVELKQSNKTNKPPLGLGKALCLTHWPPQRARNGNDAICGLWSLGIEPIHPSGEISTQHSFRYL